MSVTFGDSLVGDRYEVGDVIGRGGMGQVHKAHDRRLHRDVAIKFLRADLAADPGARQRFEDEARSAARLTHPNVVLVLDSGEHEGTPYLVMECLPGHTLKDELRDGPLDPERVTWIARDALAGIAAAHELGIVHRDVSPGNILLTDAGRAKIGDFGIAKAAESQTVTVVGQVLGTPAYVAPERLRGEPATPASDIYGLGATLYEAVGGRPPFIGDTPIAIAQQAVSSRPERLEDVRPDVPLGLVAAIDQAMDPDPERRPTAEQLEASLAGETEVAAETTAVPVVEAERTVATPIAAPIAARPRRTWDERRALLITIAVVALLGLLLLALTDRHGAKGTPANTDEPAVSTTAATAPPTTVTTAPPVARVVVPAPVKPVRQRGGHDGKAGKHGKG